MSVTERLMRPSTGSLQFRPDIPPGVSEAIRKLVDEKNGGVGAHVVLTRSRIDPAAIGDSAALGLATYTGRITKRTSRTQIGFVGIDSWLDTSPKTTITRVTGTPSQWLGDLLINGLTAGTVNASGTTNVSRTVEAFSTTRRQALDLIRELGGWEYRIRPNFTVDAATKANLFRSPPNVVVGRRAEGPDGELRGVEGAMLNQAIDVSSTASEAIVLARGQGAAIATGSATKSISLRTPFGAAPELVAVFSAPSEEPGNADAAAAKLLDQQGARYQISVSTRTHNIPDYVRPGDEIWLWEPAAGIFDMTGAPRIFRGEPSFPALARCIELEWRIRNGGVFIRPNDGSPWIDVSSWVEWETTGDDVWVVGDYAPENTGRANRIDPEIETRIAAGWANTATSLVAVDATGWSVSFGTVQRDNGLLALNVTITRTGADVTGGGNQTVTTVSSSQHSGAGNSGSRWPLPNTTSTGTSTLPQIACFYVPSSGVMSVRIPTGITWVSGGALSFAGVVPLFV